jgi:hypothetical protein
MYLHDGGIVYFGADQDVELAHVADVGLTLKTATTSDDTQATLTLQTGDTDIAANDVIGQLHFQAPDEGTGTDAILVAAGIAAISEGNFAADNNATSLVFKTGASEAAAEKMRIDSSGNLFVATTTEASDDVGHALLASGAAYHTADGTYVGLFNRKSSDGEIVQFRKDNTVIGTIGVLNSDNPFFQGTATNHGGLQCGTNAILPVKNSANSDNTIDLGQSDIRWNDIYLGGGVYIGGTSTPNKLDDYEEGTWTPAFNAGSAGTALTGTVAYSYYNRGYYTKIGRAVSVNFHAVLSNKGTGSGDMWLAGSSLPFASSGVYLASMYQPIYMTKSGQSTYTGVLYGTFDANGGMRVGFYNANSNIAFVQHSAIGNDFTVSGLLTYYV